MVLLEEKPGGHESRRVSSSGKHQCLYKISNLRPVMWERSRFLVYLGSLFPRLFFFFFCFANVHHLLDWNVIKWRRKLQRDTNHLSLYRIKIMLTVTVWFLDLALKAHHHSHLLRLSPAWSPWPVTDSIFPYFVLSWHTDTLACYLCCQHTFCTFLPSLIGLESSSFFHCTFLLG